MNIGALLFFGPLSVLGWTIFLKNLIRGKESFKWPSVEGTVTYSDIKEGANDEGGVIYVPEIYYSYEIGGASYKNSRIQFAGFTFDKSLPPDTTQFLGSKALVKKYPVNSKVTVYYNPKNPKIATLEPGIGMDNTVWFLFAVVFTIAVVMIFVGL